MPDLSPSERLALLRTLNSLPSPIFEELRFAIAVPRSLLPGDTAAQGNRGAALCDWAESVVGCGLNNLKTTLDEILAHHQWQNPSTNPSTIDFSPPATPLVNTPSSIQIFLAHAHEDTVAAMALYDRLKQRGYKPWLDKKDLIPGQKWREEIPKAIRSSDIFIACLSQHSVVKQGYVQREFKMALNECADKPPGTIYLIPLRLDDCRIPELRCEEYGINLLDFQWLDYFEPDGFKRLEQAIQFQAGDVEGVPEQQPDVNTTPSIDSRFQKLENYLKNGQWKEADYETYLLMITAVGKEEEQWFTSEELLNFPCEELLAIDDLWVKYSNGQFGFSVQKEIYLECGGIPDGKYYKEAWIKFGDRVRWRENGKWHNVIFYYTSAAPKGYLPRRVRTRVRVGDGGVGYSLFSRIQACEV